MPTRKEDNDDERQARVDAMVEEHRLLLERAARANAFVRLAQVRARIARDFAIKSRQLADVRQRTHKRA